MAKWKSFSTLKIWRQQPQQQEQRSYPLGTRSRVQNPGIFVLSGWVRTVWSLRSVRTAWSTRMLPTIVSKHAATSTRPRQMFLNSSLRSLSPSDHLHSSSGWQSGEAPLSLAADSDRFLHGPSTSTVDSLICRLIVTGTFRQLQLYQLRRESERTTAQWSVARHRIPALSNVKWRRLALNRSRVSLKAAAAAAAATVHRQRGKL